MSVTLDHLEKIQDAGKARHLKATKTSEKYAQQVIAGRKWLAEHFAKGIQPNDSCGDNEPTDSPRFSEITAPNSEEAPDSDPYSHPDFQAAFDDIPNQFSHIALALYLTFKCMHQHLKAGTGTQIRAAFKDLWKHSYVSDFFELSLPLLIIVL